MKTRFVLITLMAFGVQGIAYAASPTANPAALDRAPAADEIWGIGVRTVQAEAPLPPVSREATGRVNTLAELESAFWACDYLATTRGVDATPVATCGAVYDELKALK